jgi:hypothetical protein
MGYWITSLALIAFGIAGAMTIGLPFLIIGLAMAVLGPIRHQARVYRPIMLGLIAFNVAFMAIAPAYCSATSTIGGGSSAATCTSFIGIPWPDDATGMNVTPAAFGISLGIAIGVGIAVGGFVAYWLWHDGRRRSGSARPTASSG